MYSYMRIQKVRKISKYPKNERDKFQLQTKREYGKIILMRPRMKNTFTVKITPIHTKYCEAQRAFAEVTIDTYK